MNLSSSQILSFRRLIYRHYRAHGRHDLPWRQTRDPYKILVSEIMLQQTQVPRVIPKYREFLRRFPALAGLAAAASRDVLAAWSGLGYNRRALLLQKTARAVLDRHQGRLPRDFAALVELPGIGPATAAEISAFAFNLPHPLIETNIRSVYIHHFFPGGRAVSDGEIRPLVERTLDRKNPRPWYYALMDYGVMLKQAFPNPSRRGTGHARQSRFAGSLRQARGLIVRILTIGDETPAGLRKKTGLAPNRLAAALAGLRAEGMVKKSGTRYGL